MHICTSISFKWTKCEHALNIQKSWKRLTEMLPLWMQHGPTPPLMQSKTTSIHLCNPLQRTGVVWIVTRPLKSRLEQLPWWLRLHIVHLLLPPQNIHPPEPAAPCVHCFTLVCPHPHGRQHPRETSRAERDWGGLTILIHPSERAARRLIHLCGLWNLSSGQGLKRKHYDTDNDKGHGPQFVFVPLGERQQLRLNTSVVPLKVKGAVSLKYTAFSKTPVTKVCWGLCVVGFCCALCRVKFSVWKPY